MDGPRIKVNTINKIKVFFEQTLKKIAETLALKRVLPMVTADNMIDRFLIYA
jgi:VIT1/CCC1 family predicted Fe2+/Mn2+ transporter